MKKCTVILLCLATGILMMQTVMADTLVFTQAPGDWGVIGNWYNNTAAAPATALPGTGDNAIINNNKIAEVNGAIGTVAGTVTVANQLTAGPTGTLNVNGGGSLDYQGITYIGANGAVGTVNVQGGNLTSVNTGGRTVIQGNGAAGGGTSSVSLFNLSSGTFTAQGSAASDALFIKGATLNLSGGNLDMSGGQVVPQNNSVFNIIGGGATITMDRLNMVAADRTSAWNFAFDSSGVASVDNNAFLHLAYANINIDGSAYTGGAGTFNLFTSLNLASLPITAPTISGFGGGLSASVSQIGNDYVLTVVPEPATLGMMALLGGGMIFVRRFKR